MKTRFFVTFVIIVATVSLWGCTTGGRHLRSDAPSGGIEISATDTDSHPVSITSSSPWMVDTESGPDWFSVRYDAGDTNLLWAEALTPNESLDSLSTRITVVSGDGLRLDIPFVQLPMKVTFDVSPLTLPPFGPRESTPRILSVTSSVSWESLAMEDSDWLTLTSGTVDGAGRVEITAAPTRSLDPRRDTIVVRPTLETFHIYADSIPVVQNGIDLLVESEAMNPGNFEIDIPSGGGAIPLWVFSRSSWTVSTAAPSGRVSLDIAGGPADTGNGIPLTVTVSPNPTAEEYTFTLTFTGAGETYDYTCRQQGGAPPQGNDPPEGQENDET